MSIERALYNKICELSGVSNRVYAMRAPQNATAPFVVYQRADSDRWRHINGPSGMVQITMQIDIYAATYAQSRSLAVQLEAILDGFRGEVGYGSNSPVDKVRIAGISCQTDVDLIDETDTPLLYRVSADYLVTFEQS